MTVREPTPTVAPHRASTGIKGFDDILGGGLPPRHLYLVEGTPGSGKTTLGLQFLLQGRAAGELGLYITLSESSDELALVARSHGWDLAGIEIFDLVAGEGLREDAEQTILHPSDVELGEAIRAVIQEVERVKPSRIVFDGLSEMRMLAQSPLRYRRQILSLKNFFRTLGCTVLMLDDKSTNEGDMHLHSIAHGVIHLEQNSNDYGRDKRRLRVVKLRGVKFREGDHDFNLDHGGLDVFPRLVAQEHAQVETSRLLSTGNAELDQLLGGGLAPGSNVLFAGPSGVGKTTTAVSCAVSAMRAGGKVAYFLFDEGLGTLLTRSKALGLDVAPFVAKGQLHMRALDPAETSPGEFAHLVRRAVEQHGIRTVVIDSLNAYLQAMPGGKFLLLQMHELLTYLNLKGVVTILILSQHGVVGEARSEVDLSYLSDSLLLFRFFEARGSLLKAVSAVKSRTHGHELTIREFRVGSRGVEVGEALTDFEGVLGGIPTYRGRLPLLGDRARTPPANTR